MLTARRQQPLSHHDFRSHTQQFFLVDSNTDQRVLLRTCVLAWPALLPQVSPSLDKTGIFCRQLLDCAVVADALMDTPQASTPQHNTTCCSPPAAPSRLHRQNPAQAAAFNYSAFQSQAQAQQPAGPALQVAASAAAGGVFPATFEGLPRLSGLCIGFLEGTSSSLLSVLRSLGPGCIKGPLPAPGDPRMVRDVLPTILQAEVAISYEGLWLEGLIDARNHWWPSIQLGQLAPAATYIRAQQLRALLLQQMEQYFEAYGIQVLLKPARSNVGLDGLPALLDMPEVLLPVEIGTETSSAADFVADSGPSPSSRGSGSQSGSGSGPGDAGRSRDSTGSVGGNSRSSGSGSEEAWTQPVVNSILALPGADAAAVAVGAAFQSVTDFHLRCPPLPEPGSREAKDTGQVYRG